MSAPQCAGSTILLVEDDPALATMLHDRLEAKGYAVWHAEHAAEGEAMADALRPDLIILDLMLPDTHGLVLCARLREQHAAPIVICSAAGRWDDPALGRALGADDFIHKPFSSDELEARVEAALRRASSERYTAQSGEQPPPVGPLVIDQARCTVTVGGDVIPLTPTEYRLLCLLAARPNAVLSREELAEPIWGCYDASIGKSLEVHLRRLRAKLKGGPVPGPTVGCVRGFGYRLAWEPDGGAGSPAVLPSGPP